MVRFSPSDFSVCALAPLIQIVNSKGYGSHVMIVDNENLDKLLLPALDKATLAQASRVALSSRCKKKSRKCALLARKSYWLRH